MLVIQTVIQSDGFRDSFLCSRVSFAGRHLADERKRSVAAREARIGRGKIAVLLDGRLKITNRDSGSLGALFVPEEKAPKIGLVRLRIDLPLRSRLVLNGYKLIANLASHLAGNFCRQRKNIALNTRVASGPEVSVCRCA